MAPRNVLAQFLGAESADLVFVANATTGVNAVLRSLLFEPGDELLTTTHTYAACRKTIDYVVARTGARVVVASVPFPLSTEQEVVEAVLACASPQTRLALIDHVTSPTALVLPVARLVAELRNARRRDAGGRRARSRHGAARARRDRRCVLHGQCAQVDVRAQGRRFSARAPRLPRRALTRR